MPGRDIEGGGGHKWYSLSGFSIKDTVVLLLMLLDLDQFTGKDA
jgi:hypothetical protein